MEFLTRLSPVYWITRIKYSLTLREFTGYVEDLRNVINSGDINNIERYLTDAIRCGKKAIRQICIVPDSEDRTNLESMLEDIIKIQKVLYAPPEIPKNPFAKYSPN